ncbi:hypothetical protein [Polymorphospora lycopeni]|uniref:Uncharacterized protein n=1 Tax=Polymorphospora lycopeni TaxID=3140240 RepID=A0ABV5CQA3_9ACTN
MSLMRHAAGRRGWGTHRPAGPVPDAVREGTTYVARHTPPPARAGP